MDFNVVSDYKPTGDQPEAIKQLTEGIENGERFQTLLGVTGSGKTFTMANVIKEVQRPTLLLSHNKTLAAQLYSEMKQFFPNNAVEYFVSYYDYYQPEAYLPTTDTYIEKDLSINEDIEKLRLSATSALLSGRRDVVVVSSVSCLYGIGNPEDFHANVTKVKVGDEVSRNALLYNFVEALYSRSEVEFKRGNFRVKGDTVDIYPAYADVAYRITFWGDEIEELSSFDPEDGLTIETLDEIVIYPANIFVTTKDRMKSAIHQIQDDLDDFNQESNTNDINSLRPSVVLAILGEKNPKKMQSFVQRHQRGDISSAPELYLWAKKEGAVTEAQNMLLEYRQQALNILDQLKDPNIKILLYRLLNRIIGEISK